MNRLQFNAEFKLKLFYPKAVIWKFFNTFAQ